MPDVRLGFEVGKAGVGNRVARIKQTEGRLWLALDALKLAVQGNTMVGEEVLAEQWAQDILRDKKPEAIDG